LDTLVKVAHISDMNDYSKVMKALDPFLHMARESGAHLHLVHHAGKSDRNGGDNLLGSTAIFGTVDTCLIQKRSDKYRTIESINRYGMDLEETVLEWNEDTKAISLGESKKDTEVERLSKEITAFLETQEEPVLRELIEANVEGGTGPQRKALKKLVDTGRVERIGKGTRGNPFLFSCLVVPSIDREQENKKAKNDQTPHEQKADSCSQSSMDFEGSRESREQEKEGVLGEKNGVFEEVDL